jgi:predicted O-linked N-acetylglucosamine transferase (SPINDLY family)
MLRGRQTAGMLSLMGLTGTIAASESDYVETCAALLRDTDRRDALRGAMLAGQSVLFDDERPVSAFADFLQTVEMRS